MQDRKRQDMQDNAMGEFFFEKLPMLMGNEALKLQRLIPHIPVYLNTDCVG